MKSVQRGIQSLEVQGAMVMPDPVTISISAVNPLSASLIANIEGAGSSSANINANVGCQLTSDSIILSFSLTGYHGRVSWQVVEFY